MISIIIMIDSIDMVTFYLINDVSVSADDSSSFSADSTSLSQASSHSGSRPLVRFQLPAAQVHVQLGSNPLGDEVPLGEQFEFIIIYRIDFTRFYHDIYYCCVFQSLASYPRGYHRRHPPCDLVLHYPSKIMKIMKKLSTTLHYPSKIMKIMKKLSTTLHYPSKIMKQITHRQHRELRP